jgi:hypothetical protein
VTALSRPRWWRVANWFGFFGNAAVGLLLLSISSYACTASFLVCVICLINLREG